MPIYSTVREMHIAIEQKLNVISSSLFGRLHDDEKDLWLNIATLRFVTNRLKRELDPQGTGHQATRKRISDLEEIVSETTLKAYKVSAEKSACILPPDYLHPLNEDCKIYYNCNSFTPSTTSSPLRYVILPFPLAYKPASATKFYEKLQIQFTDSAGPATEVIFDPTVYNQYATGIDDPDDYFYIVNYIMDVINNNGQGVKVYWENFGTINKSGSFILVLESSLLTMSQAQIGSTVTGSFVAKSTVSSINAPNTIYEIGTTDVVTKNVDLRVVSQEQLRHSRNHPYRKTGFDSPLSVYQDGRLLIFNDTTFVPSEVLLTYYRYPRNVSLRSNMMCELKFRDEIVNLAAELISGARMNPNQELILRSNALQE